MRVTSSWLDINRPLIGSIINQSSLGFANYSSGGSVICHRGSIFNQPSLGYTNVLSDSTSRAWLNGQSRLAWTRFSTSRDWLAVHSVSQSILDLRGLDHQSVELDLTILLMVSIRTRPSRLVPQTARACIVASRLDVPGIQTIVLAARPAQTR